MALGLPRALLDLLFPPRCAVCGATGADLCDACRGKIRQPPAPRCARCDLPLIDGGSAGGLCAACAAGARAPALDRMLVAAVYEGTARAAIHALKYHGKRRAAVPLAGLLASVWRASGARADVIVPVPLHASRIRQRGFNQSDLLARELGRETGLPLRRDTLTRVRATAPQTRLNWSERQRNVAGAFTLRREAATLAGRAILLVDDVMTTGATLQAAASALREAGPAAIVALTVARPLRAPDGAPAHEP